MPVNLHVTTWSALLWYFATLFNCNVLGLRIKGGVFVRHRPRPTLFKEQSLRENIQKEKVWKDMKFTWLIYYEAD